MPKKSRITSEMTRRQFIKVGAAGAVAFAVLPRPILKAARADDFNIPIALQLYSVREDCAQDFDRALTRVAAMGYAGVEFAGYFIYQDDPKGLRRRLDDLGLRVAGTHISTSAISGEALEASIDFHRILGCKYLIVPSDRDFTDPEKSKQLAEIFNTAAEALKPLDMYCGFHNHKNEFSLFQGKSYWDLFAERTQSDVVLQLDVGWALAAGQDPARIIRQYPGRSQTVHFKPTVGENDMDKIAILGEDSVNWNAVLQACSEKGGTKWIIIEQEYYPGEKSPMECSELSLHGLQKIIENREG